MIRFRTSNKQDTSALARIWRASVLATHDFLSSEDFSEIEIAVTAQYLPNTSLLLAVDRNDVPLGFLGMSNPHIDSLFIAPEQRGKGIGKALIEQAAMEAAKHGHPELTVDVNEQNGQAVAFYKQIGFIQHGRSPTDSDGRPYPLLHMRWALPAAPNVA